MTLATELALCDARPVSPAHALGGRPYRYSLRATQLVHRHRPAATPPPVRLLTVRAQCMGEAPRRRQHAPVGPSRTYTCGHRLEVRTMREQSRSLVACRALGRPGLLLCRSCTSSLLVCCPSLVLPGASQRGSHQSPGTSPLSCLPVESWSPEPQPLGFFPIGPAAVRAWVVLARVLSSRCRLVLPPRGRTLSSSWPSLHARGTPSLVCVAALLVRAITRRGRRRPIRLSIHTPRRKGGRCWSVVVCILC